MPVLIFSQFFIFMILLYVVDFQVERNGLDAFGLLDSYKKLLGFIFLFPPFFIFILFINLQACNPP